MGGLANCKGALNLVNSRGTQWQGQRILSVIPVEAGIQS